MKPLLQVFVILILHVDTLFCVLGSDGLFNALEKSTVIRMITDCSLKGLSGNQICERIVNAAKSQYDKHQSASVDDDISICILFFNQSLVCCKRLFLCFSFFERFCTFCLFCLSGSIAGTRPSTPLIRCFSKGGEKIIASKNTAGVKRDPSVMNQLKRGSQRVSVKNMLLLLVATNVVLAGLIYNKNRKQRNTAENKQN